MTDDQKRIVRRVLLTLCLLVASSPSHAVTTDSCLPSSSGAFSGLLASLPGPGPALAANGNGSKLAAFVQVGSATAHAKSGCPGQRTDCPASGLAPEPSTLVLTGSSLLGLGLLLRRRFTKREQHVQEG